MGTRSKIRALPTTRLYFLTAPSELLVAKMQSKRRRCGTGAQHTIACLFQRRRRLLNFVQYASISWLFPHCQFARCLFLLNEPSSIGQLKIVYTIFRFQEPKYLLKYVINVMYYIESSSLDRQLHQKLVGGSEYVDLYR